MPEEKRGLVKQNEQERAMRLVNSVEQKRALQAKSEDSKEFSSLFVKFADSCLGISKKDLKKEGFNEEGLQYLANCISKKIGFWHKITAAYVKFVSLIFALCEHIEKTYNTEFAEFVGICIIIGAVFVFPILVGAVIYSTLVAIFLIGANISSCVLAMNHENCDKCKYLQSLSRLKKCRGTQYFPVEEVRRLL